MKQHYPIINLLRGVAALMVCLYHFISFEDHWGSLFWHQETIRQIAEIGIQGVFIFFVISGVVIPASMFSGNYETKNILKFLWRRWIRIELPYIASIVLILMVAFAFTLRNNNEFIFEFSRLVNHLTYTIPFSNHEWYNVIYWTLAIEFQFYILIGLLYYFLRNSNKWFGIGSCILLILGAYLISDTRFVFYYGPIFAIGIATFLLKIERIDKLDWVLLILFGAIIAFNILGFATSVFALLTAVVIGLLDRPIRDFGLGKISYSLYLTHGVVGGNLIYWLGRDLPNDLFKYAMVFLAVLTSLLFAWLFWKYIEEPSRILSKKVKIN